MDAERFITAQDAVWDEVLAEYPKDN